MKKLIFCCLVVFMGACKDKDKEVDPERDFAAGFVGEYQTTTIEGSVSTLHTWNVEKVNNNQLKIAYGKDFAVEVPGGVLSGWQKLELGDVTTTSAERFTIDETVTVEQNAGATFTQRLEGQGTKVISAAGNPQINVDLKITTSTTGVSTSHYLEFKKR
jgi:hypothetical protein